MLAQHSPSLPPSLPLSLSLSLFVTPTLPRPLPLHSPLAVFHSHSVERANRRQQAAAEERAGRQLQPPLQQIVPPVQWKLNGRVAEGMEGRAAGQVGPAATSHLRHDSHMLHLLNFFNCSTIFFTIFPFHVLLLLLYHKLF